jgi:hypothetical protein
LEQQEKFAYTMSFCERLDKAKIKMHVFSDFAPADTAEKAIENLASLLRGSLPFKQLLAQDCVARLTKIELMSNAKRVFMLPALEDTESLTVVPWMKKEKLTVHWGWMGFEHVDRDLLGALVKTFPEQKQIFKGKFLEDAMGL